MIIYLIKILILDQTEFCHHNVAFMHTALARNRLLRDLNSDVLPIVDDLLYR